MAKFTLLVLEVAIQEYEEAVLFYNKEKAGLGKEFEQEIRSLFHIIQENPLLFPIKFAHIHEAVIARFPFVVNYEVSEKQIIVLSVFHTKKSPIKKWRRVKQRKSKD